MAKKNHNEFKSSYSMGTRIMVWILALLMFGGTAVTTLYYFIH